MKLIFKGIFKDIEQLPKGKLPENAVKFREPSNMLKLNLTAAIFLIPALLLVEIFKLGSYAIHGCSSHSLTMLGIFLAFIMIFPHELLHAVCFGKDAEVELYIAPKSLSAFVTSTYPISKARFVFLSLLPNVVFGWIPLFVWMILPCNPIYSSHLFTFAFFSLLFGGGDYMNAYNALRQMPKGSMQQLSGFHSYWFVPQD